MPFGQQLHSIHHGATFVLLYVLFLSHYCIDVLVCHSFSDVQYINNIVYRDIFLYRDYDDIICFYIVIIVMHNDAELSTKFTGNNIYDNIILETFGRLHGTGFCCIDTFHTHAQ